MTKRPQVIFGLDKETLSDLAEENKPTPFEGRVRRAEAWARNVLIEAKHKASELDDTRTLLLIAQQAEASGNADSDEDFAARILKFILYTREAIEAGKAVEAATYGLHLGELIVLHDTKSRHEPTWRTGHKQRNTLKDTSDRANAKRHALRERMWARWNSQAAPVWKKNPGHSANAVAKIIKDKHNIPDNQKTIARHLKKPGQAG